jgi:hypothetical protein
MVDFSPNDLMLSGKEFDSLCTRLIGRLGEDSFNVSEQGKAVGICPSSDKSRKLVFVTENTGGVQLRRASNDIISH